jgi:putative membrane protein
MTALLVAHDGMDGMMGAGHGWMMVVWSLLWLLALAAVLAVAVFGILRFSDRPTVKDDEANMLLRRRYALGEIDRDEYLSRRDDLDSTR